MRFSEQTDAIDAAMAKARGEFLPIDKGRTADTGTFKYDYADLADIFDATTEALSKNGLVFISDVWTVREPTLTACSQSYIRHSSGQWYESSVLEMPTTPNGKMGPSQLLGSAQSYGRRYQALGILGLMPRSEDDDGHDASATGATTAARQPRQPDPNAPHCPKCQAIMTTRHGKDGDFWGCTKYPTCRGTMPIVAPGADPQSDHDSKRQAQSGEENQTKEPPKEKVDQVYVALSKRLREIGCTDTHQAAAVVRFVCGQVDGKYEFNTMDSVKMTPGAPARVMMKIVDALKDGLPETTLLHDALEQAGILQTAGTP